MRIEVPVESFTIRSKDGAGVRVHKTGTGPHRWLLTPGLGTPLLCWKHIFEAFHQRMTIVTWDQRGLFDSERLRDRSALRFERHVDDAEAIVEHLGWDSFVTGSWSMGVQLGLGLYERMPERIQALALINGAFEHVLSTAYGPALTAPLLRATLAGLVRGARVLNPAARRLLASGTAGLLMDKLSVSTANAPFVTAVTQELARVELGTYFGILLELDRHSARPVLDKVKVPTLVTSGSKDVATPPSVMRELSRRIPHADYVEIERGTHYTPLEYPEALNHALERFFSRVFAERWPPAGASSEDAVKPAGASE